jgi:hypothetical protein
MVDLTVANAVLLATRRCRKVMAEYVYIGWRFGRPWKHIDVVLLKVVH